MVDQRVLRRDFGLRLLRLGRRWRQAVDSELRRFGLTTATWRALFYVGRFGNGIRLKDLAEALDMERPSLGQLVDRLEREGLVERQGARDDRRGKTIHLTPSGREIYDRTMQVATAVGDRMTGELSDQELTQCAGILDRINAAIDEMGREAEES